MKKLLLAIAGGVAGGLLWGLFTHALTEEPKVDLISPHFFLLSCGFSVLMVLGAAFWLFLWSEPLSTTGAMVFCSSVVSCFIYLLLVLFWAQTAPPSWIGLFIGAAIHGAITGIGASLGASLSE